MFPLKISNNNKQKCKILNKHKNIPIELYKIFKNKSLKMNKILLIKLIKHSSKINNKTVPKIRIFLMMSI